MDRHLREGSNYSIAREDRLERQAVLRGMVLQVVWELTGGLDDMANELLGLPSVSTGGAPPHEPYMDYEPTDSPSERV